MGNMTDTGWVPETSGAWTEQIRADIERRGISPDWDRTNEGAWTDGLGLTGSRIDQGFALVVDAIDIRRARGAVLDAHGQQAGVPRKPATRSQYTFRATATTGSLSYTAGLQVEDASGQRWRVVDTTTITTTPTGVVFEALDEGPVTITTATTLRIVNPLDRLGSVTFDPADDDPVTVGTFREKDPPYRVRIQRASLGHPLRAQLEALSWVTKASVVRTAPGVLRVSVVPTPTAAQAPELFATIRDGIDPGIDTDDDGATLSDTVILDDGVSTDTIHAFTGDTETVTVVRAVSVETGFVQSDVEDDVDAAIDEVFASIEQGQTLKYVDVYCAAAAVEGVDNLALTLNGGVANVSPTLSTNILTRST